MSNGNRTTILTIVGVAVIMLVIGVAIGSVAFPMTKTDTIKRKTTITETQTVIDMITQTQPLVTGETTYAQNITYELMSSISCTSTATAHTLSDVNGAGVFYIQVNYTGIWSGAIFGYNGRNNSSPVYVLCMTGQSGNFATTAPDKNPYGMSTVCVEAQKQDNSSKNSTLSVGVTWGAALQGKNTTLPLGIAQVCETVVP